MRSFLAPVCILSYSSLASTLGLRILTLEPGVDTVGEGLRERISRRVAFLMGKVVGVAKTSGSLTGWMGRASLLGEAMMGTGAAAMLILVRFSTGGGLDRVGLGFILGLRGSSRRPPPIGLLRRVPSADSALNSHLTMVSLIWISGIVSPTMSRM